MAEGPQSGAFRLVVEKSSWSNGKLPPDMRLEITLDINGDDFEYHAVNTTWSVENPYRVDFKAVVDGTPYPSTGSGIDSVALTRLLPDEYQLNKTLEGAITACEYWRFVEDGNGLIKHGSMLQDGAIMAYVEYFARRQ